MPLPPYRDRAADARAIGNFFSGAAETVTTAASNIATATGDAALDFGRSIVSGIIGAVNDIAPSAIPTATAALAQLSYMGQVGNFQSAQEYLVLSAKFQKIVDGNPEYQGSPLFRRVYLNTLSGFLQCGNPEFTCTTATATEITAVEALMAAGMFYE